MVHSGRLLLGSVLALCSSGCFEIFSDVSSCTRDGECGAGEVCFGTGQCYPRGVAVRLGGIVGEECSVQAGVEQGCDTSSQCVMGMCGGSIDPCSTAPDAPVFGRITAALADGPDAVILQWTSAFDNGTPALAMTYEIFQSQTSGLYDFSAPIAVVTATNEHRVSGLSPGAQYYFVVRARDPDGLLDCNRSEVSVALSADCIDYETVIQPIFDGRCSSCHSASSPLQGLSLENYNDVIIGGASGSIVTPCEPQTSFLFEKISEDNPSVGERMPLLGIPLEQAQLDLVEQWIAEGARQSCSDPEVCP